ncbi:hypothetical protein KFK09_010697 [Dendrobium nobile]|uniref:Uncharacterized protein n=1 Tax=Dendrobium nobile TaxID=94219 RepID=A0A8T3BCS0_DENNO|nr:hypothetical protein KFK09_010697 [Dendrobium nobile]
MHGTNPRNRIIEIAKLNKPNKWRGSVTSDPIATRKKCRPRRQRSWLSTGSKLHLSCEADEIEELQKAGEDEKQRPAGRWLSREKI